MHAPTYSAAVRPRYLSDAGWPARFLFQHTSSILYIHTYTYTHSGLGAQLGAIDGMHVNVHQAWLLKFCNRRLISAYREDLL